MIWNLLTCVALLWCALLTAWRFVDGLKDFRALVDAVQKIRTQRAQPRQAEGGWADNGAEGGVFPGKASATRPITPIAAGGIAADVVSALVGMGYSKTTAVYTVAHIPDGSREEMLKAALRVVNQ